MKNQKQRIAALRVQNLELLARLDAELSNHAHHHDPDFDLMMTTDALERISSAIGIEIHNAVQARIKQAA